MDSQVKRSPFQGVANIVRFNWPFYLLAAVGIAGLLAVVSHVPIWLSLWLTLLAGAVLMTTLVSLLVSHYIYDWSDLYRLNWLPEMEIGPDQQLITINAGFDETSALLAQAYPQARLQVFDFYDPALHTEPSIERARRAYPAYPETVQVTTRNLPIPEATVAVTFIILAAHEIRDDAERIQFFKEIARTLRPDGQLVVVEHLRDWSNFLAYTIGFFHFLSRRTWLRTFEGAGLIFTVEHKITPFISAFFLRPNGAKS